MANNAKEHPEAWRFFIEHARNIKKEKELKHLGLYRIPVPDQSGNFIYANDTGILWYRFIQEWYKVGINSPSVYGKIQYIVQNF